MSTRSKKLERLALWAPAEGKPGELDEMSDDFASHEDRTTYITWDDVDRIEAPGRVTVEGRSFQVEQAHIDVWKDHPRGAWSLREVRANGLPKWVLSSFYQTRDNV